MSNEFPRIQLFINHLKFSKCHIFRLVVEGDGQKLSRESKAKLLACLRQHTGLRAAMQKALYRGESHRPSLPLDAAFRAGEDAPHPWLPLTEIGVLLAFVIRPRKHPCQNRAEWRLPPGKPPERLPDYYHFDCDFETSLMLALHDVHRAEPIYLCGTHAAKTGLSAAASASETKSPESAPLRITFKPPAANTSSALDAPRGRLRWYILVLVAILAVAGGLFGPKLFRGSAPRSSKPIAMAKPRKAPAGNTLPQMAPRKDQAAASQKQSQPVPKQPVLKRNTRKNAQPATRSVQTADVAAKGTIARRVVPDVPKSASDTIRGTILVSVRVLVNASGNVEHTELVFRGPSRYFARLSVEAARRWKFHPPVAAGKNSPSEWLIRFYFTRKATSADASEELRAERRRK